VAADDDMLDFQVHDGVADDAEGVQVARVQDVGDVAVHEDIAGLEAQERGFGDAGVGAADPEDLRGLALCEGGEEGGVVGGGSAGPGFVLGEGAREAVCVVRRELMERSLPKILKQMVGFGGWGGIEVLMQQR